MGKARAVVGLNHNTCGCACLGIVFGTTHHGHHLQFVVGSRHQSHHIGTTVAAIVAHQLLVQFGVRGIIATLDIYII